MATLQLALFFAGGLLLSRVIIATRWPERVVFGLFHRRQLTERRVMAYFVVLSAALSLLIPNALTVLTLLPILEALRDAHQDEDARRRAATAMGLAVVYGANIGGIGSVTATPANAILVAFVELKGAPGREVLHFASWLAWGIPLVAVLVGVAIAVLWLTLGFRSARTPSVDLVDAPDESARWRQGFTLVFGASYLAGATTLSAALLMVPARARLWVALAALLTAALAMVALFIPLGKGAQRRPLLRVRECFVGLPWRGFALVLVAVAIAGALYLARFHLVFSRWIAALIPARIPAFFALLAVALVASFSTELLSNTAVQLAFFALLEGASGSLGVSLLQGATVASLSSTCAFMSPIATGVNGLAVGGLKGMSWAKMASAGLVMNIAAALVIAGWLRWVVG